MRYSPSGDQFASAGFDGHVYIFDSKSYDQLADLGPPAHKGGVYAVSLHS